MSRLDSFIRRVSAQRDCLNHIARLMADVPGPVLELGLGNGRTYDHLREILADREIFVFDRRVAAHPECVPDDDHMILGDFTETVPGARERIGDLAALAHCDVGTGEPDVNARVAAFLGEALPPLVRSGGYILCDQDVKPAGWEPLPLPEGVQPGRYFIYRRP